jgi:hypothetical protein
LRCEKTHEGARNLQESSRNTGEHISQLDCTGFHRNWSLSKRGGKKCSAQKEIGRRERGSQSFSPKGGRREARVRRSTEEDGGRRWRGIAGGGEGIARNREEAGAGREKTEPLARSGWRPFFKNAIWAHRTVYSACPVHTGHRTVAVR